VDLFQHTIQKDPLQSNKDLWNTLYSRSEELYGRHSTQFKILKVAVELYSAKHRFNLRFYGACYLLNYFMDV